jgi:smad nuclear-interacting protein 1
MESSRHERERDRGRHSRDDRDRNRDDIDSRSRRQRHRSRSRDQDRSPRPRVKDEDESPPRRRKDYSPHERSSSPPPRRERERNSDSKSSRNRYTSSRRSRSPEAWGSHKRDLEYDREHPPRPRSPPKEKERPNYGLSGLLAAATNMKNGIVLKYNEPPEAKKTKGWRIYVFKDGKEIDALNLDGQSSFLIGKDRMV